MSIDGLGAGWEGVMVMHCIMTYWARKSGRVLLSLGCNNPGLSKEAFINIRHRIKESSLSSYVYAGAYLGKTNGVLRM